MTQQLIWTKTVLISLGILSAGRCGILSYKDDGFLFLWAIAAVASAFTGAFI